jgi:hypothetical protein
MARYTETELRAAVGDARCLSDVLRHFGLRAAGGNFRVLRSYLERWAISTDHFDENAARRGRARASRPLAEVLVPRSGYSRRRLKERLYSEGIKQRACELCGQGEDWRGRTMSLVLDHVNGVHDDNRLENLRIVCPNCAATLDTHCGRRNRLERERVCLRCGMPFVARAGRQRYCSTACGSRWDRSARRAPRPERRRVERPPLDALRAEVERDGFLAVGRRLGVSDNAMRKWFRGAGQEPPRRLPAAAGSAGAGGDGSPD